MRLIARCFVIVMLLSSWVAFAQPGMGPGMGSGHWGDPGGGNGNYPGWGGHELEHNLVLPQVAVGGEITTTLSILNMGNRQRLAWIDPQDLVTSGTVRFFQQDGSPFVVHVNGTETSAHRFSLDSSEMLFLEITADGPPTPGWMLIEVDDGQDDSPWDDWGMMDGHGMGRGERVMATAYYTIEGTNGEVVSQVAVIPAVFEQQRFFNSVIPVQVSGTVNTGVAIVNTSGEDASIELAVRDAQGQKVASRMVSLPAGHQRAEFLDQLFESSTLPSDFRGSLEIQTTLDGVVGLGLLSTDGVLTSIPMHHYGRWGN